MYIKQGFKLKSQIDALNWKYDSLRFSSSKPDNPSSSFQNGTENRLIKLAEIKKQIEALQHELEKVTYTIEDFIEKSNIDEKYQVVLIHRYCYLETFSKIANDLGFSERYIYNLHKNAMKKISISSVSNHLDIN